MLLAKPDNPVKRLASSWILPFALVSVFSTIPLIDFGGVLRKYFLLIGFLLCIFCAFVTLVRQNQADRLLLLFAIATLIFWAVAYPPAINGNDDNTAYLVFAEQFANRFSDSIHPLSERRLFSLGASYAFQGPILLFLGAKWLSLFEPVLGLALLFILATKSSTHDGKLKQACLIPCLFIAILPLAGSAYLANTSSVFVLSAFTYAILLLCAKPFRVTSILSSWDVFWAVLFCVYASLLRPTTTPFNVIVLAFALLYSIWKRKSLALYIFPVLGVLSIFLVVTYGFSKHFATRLYPLLGRGYHITSVGYSTFDGFSTLSHLRNIVATLFTDPIVLLALVISFLAIASSSSKSRLPYVLALSAFIFSAVLITVSTGGLAAKRYLFPVAIATSLFSYSALDFGMVPFLRPLVQYSRQIRVLLVMLVFTLLLLPRYLIGDEIISKRMLMYTPSSRDSLSIQDLKYNLKYLGSASKILLVSTGLERFIVARIDADFAIMDQPGMMLPWAKSDPSVSYQDGLRAYLDDFNIRAVVARGSFVSQPGLAIRASPSSHLKGWTGLMELAAKQNSTALANILQDWKKTDLGSLVLYTR